MTTLPHRQGVHHERWMARAQGVAGAGVAGDGAASGDAPSVFERAMTDE